MTYRLPSYAIFSTRGRDDWLDDFVARSYRDRLELALRDFFPMDRGGLELSVARDSDGLLLEHAGAVQAWVRATNAELFKGPRVHGNFLLDGEHWYELADRIAERTQRHAADERVPAEPGERRERELVEFPTGLDPDLALAAMHASEDIRLRRNFVFDHAVVLTVARRPLARLDPLRIRDGLVEAPFDVSMDGEHIAGALRLRGDQDPLTVAVSDQHPDLALGVAWAVALIAFAEITCREQSEHHRGWRSTDGEPRGFVTAPPPPRSPATVSVRAFPPTLQPNRQTSLYLATYVAGHRRQLQPLQQASHQARAQAELVGITLRPHETWVRPHIRGVPDDAVLQFAWRAPPVIARTIE